MTAQQHSIPINQSLNAVSGVASRTPTALIIVHGTFARAAHWTRRDSPFIRAIQQRVNFDYITALEWSGANTFRARLDGANLLECHISDLERSHPGCRLIVVCHSHGGSVVAYWLKQDVLNNARLSGIAFISTPFIGIRISHHWYALAYHLTFALLALFGLWLIVILVPVLTKFLALTLTFATNNLIFVLLCFGVVILVGEPLTRSVVAIGSFTLSRMPNLAERMSEYIRRVNTADLSIDHALFLRVTGDEAAAALSASQFANWLLTRIHLLLLSFMTATEKVQEKLTKLTKVPSWLRLMVIHGVGMCFLLVAIEIGYLRTEELARRLLPTPIYWFAALCVTLFCASVVLNLLLVLLVLLSILPATLLFLPFGRALPLISLFLQASVEPIPWGTHRLTHLQWREEKKEFHIERTNVQLSHSDGYMLDGAIESICQWMSSRLSTAQDYDNHA